MIRRNRFVLALTCSVVTGALGCSGVDPQQEDNAGSAPSAVGEVHAALDGQVQIGAALNGAPRNFMKYFQCAGEGDTCNMDIVPRYVAFGPTGGGAASSYFYKVVSGTFACLPGVFGAPAHSSTSRTCYYSPYTPMLNNRGTPAQDGDLSGVPLTGTFALGRNGVFRF